MSREKTLQDLRGVLDHLYGQDEYGFFMEIPQEEGSYDIKYQHIFGVAGAKCDAGTYGGGENTPGIILRTCTPAESHLEKWGSFFCLLIQKEIQVNVHELQEGYILCVQVSGCEGGLAGLLRRVGVSDYQEGVPIRVLDESMWVDQLTDVGR